MLDMIITDDDNGVTESMIASGTGSLGQSTGAVPVDNKDDNNKLSLYWCRLTYKVSDKTTTSSSSSSKSNTGNNNNNKCGLKTIVNDMNGQMSSGSLTGILGPSGAGKTTLIECLAGRRLAGLTGRVWAKSTAKKKVKLRIAYNAQSDSLINELTVEEALRYASQLTSGTHKPYDFYHRHNHTNGQSANGIDDTIINNNNNTIRYTVDTTRLDGLDSCRPLSEPLVEPKYSTDPYVHQLIEAIGLGSCAHVRTGSISGGQKKRLSIALELIFSPNVLLLDEPTTGLDSRSSYQCLSLLKTLSANREPLIIGASIHQPTARLLGFFDNIYVLSVDGQCVYSGPTQTLVEHLSKFGLNCPVFHNPADYVIEIASGGHGSDAIETLVAYERHKSRPLLDHQTVSKDELISGDSRLHRKNNHRFSIHLPPDNFSQQFGNSWILIRRSGLVSVRQPLNYWLRILGLLFSLLSKLIIYSKVSGHQSATSCVNSDDVFQKLRSIHLKESSIQKSFRSIQNISYILTTMMFIHFCTIAPTLMTFPIELNTFVKERFNKWYTTWSYFMAKSIVDIPVVIVLPVVYAGLLWLITGQAWDLWRFSIHLVVIVLLALVSHGMGLLLSAIFISNVRAALMSFAIFVVPFLLTSGALIPIRTMPGYMQTLSYLSIFRLTYEAMLIILYGFDRCPGAIQPITMDDLGHEFAVNIGQLNDCLDWSDATANLTTGGLKAFNRYLTGQHPSKMLDWFALRDQDLYKYIALLSIYTVIFQVLAYLALRWKAKIK
ncbi:ATP-binding cassette sub-family G member 1-like [Oppia nitens]|uniref:ATP-binding cassette sub-family G member 1-like n=1 Tax=Oppia nitens TaxID=1686743 RepID=UPI0023DADB64|nr:ATP-binding cassette sub-family G member 1-like [Oppia nitens]